MRLVVLLLCLMSAFAKADSQTAEALYQKSGLAEQVSQLPVMVTVSIDAASQRHPSASTLSPGYLKVFKRAAHLAFEPERMKHHVVGQLQASLSATELQEAMAWYESPIGRKVATLEKAASQPQAHQEFVRFVQRALQWPSSESRLDLIRDLNAVSKASESGVQVTMAIQLAVLTGLNGIRGEGSRSPAELSQQLEASRSQVERQVITQTLLSLSFTYRSLTEAELSAYIDYLQSDTGRKLTAATTQGLGQAMVESGVIMGDAMAEMLEHERHRKSA